MALGILIGSLAVLVIGINVSYGFDINSTLPYISNDDMGRVVDYCYSHADSPNPIQDLINQGLLDPAFSSQTCSQMKLQKEIDDQDQKAMEFMKDLAESDK